MINASFSNIERDLLSNIIKTKNNIKIAVAWFTNPKLFASLITLFNEGKSVEIILSDDISNFINKNINFQELIDKGIEIRISRFPKLMHNKFCIIDERLLITGSYNWTKSAELNNHENIIISNELLLVTQFNNQFIELKKNTEQLISISTTKFSSYISKIETEEELKLITDIDILNSENNNNKDKEQSENVEIDEKIKKLLDKADLLYLQGKHQNAIDFCLGIISKHPNLAEAYVIIAYSKWRLKRFNEQIEYAQKAIDLNNQNYDAYNVLGIGYSHKGNSQKSIENYQICIIAEPEAYIYYRNRAISYRNLSSDLSVTKNLRDQFIKKEILDLHKIIELTNRLQAVDNSYKLFLSRGFANLNLANFYPAKMDLLKAKELYEQTDKKQQDSHEYKELNQDLKYIDKITKS